MIGATLSWCLEFDSFTLTLAFEVLGAIIFCLFLSYYLFIYFQLFSIVILFLLLSYYLKQLLWWR